MRFRAGSRSIPKARATPMTMPSPCCPMRRGSGGRSAGGSGLLSHTLTHPSRNFRSSRLGPGAYLRVLVTSSLTTSSTRSGARSLTGTR